MVKLFVRILILLSFCGQVGAQVSDRAIEQMMDKRLMACREVEYNSMLLLPRLYREGKTDTFEAVISYWQKHCGLNEPLFTVRVLNSIKNRVFAEKIDGHDFLEIHSIRAVYDTNVYSSRVLRFLIEYKNASGGHLPNYLAWGWKDEDSDVANGCRNYYRYLRQMATELQHRGGLTPVEDFLVRYYADPENVKLQEIDSPSRKGTVLQRQYELASNFNNNVHGTSMGLYFGTWTGTGGLALFGTQPLLGCHFGGRSSKVLFDLRLDAMFGNSRSPFLVSKGDSVYKSSELSGIFAGAQIGRRVMKTDKSELDIVSGVGYNMLEILRVNTKTSNGDKDSSIVKTVNSWNVNIGFSYKYYIGNSYRNYKRRFTYLAIEPAYNFVHFNNNGGTDMGGGYFAIRLTLGGYIHGYGRYPNLN